jgi:hypothetical protein
MKIRSSIGISLFACFIAISIGCQTSIKSTRVAIITIDAAMQAWAEYVNSGKATPEQISKVHLAYGRYYAAIESARAATIAYKTSNNTNDLQRTLIAVAAAQPQVLNLILQFLPTEKVVKLQGLK